MLFEKQLVSDREAFSYSERNDLPSAENAAALSWRSHVDGLHNYIGRAYGIIFCLKCRTHRARKPTQELTPSDRVAQ